MPDKKQDKFKDECGVFAIYGHPEAANLAYLGLYALQHRGQESAGIATSDGREIYCHKAMGHVADIFTPEVRKTRNCRCWRRARLGNFNLVPPASTI